MRGGDDSGRGGGEHVRGLSHARRQRRGQVVPAAHRPRREAGESEREARIASSPAPRRSRGSLRMSRPIMIVLILPEERAARDPLRHRPIVVRPSGHSARVAAYRRPGGPRMPRHAGRSRASDRAPRRGRPPGFGRAKSVILVYANGGQSQLETWDPKPDAPAEIRGEFRADPDRRPRHLRRRAPAAARPAGRPLHDRPQRLARRPRPRLGHLPGPDRPLPPAEVVQPAAAADRLPDPRRRPVAGPAGRRLALHGGPRQRPGAGARAAGPGPGRRLPGPRVRAAARRRRDAGAGRPARPGPAAGAAPGAARGPALAARGHRRATAASWSRDRGLLEMDGLYRQAYDLLGSPRCRAAFDLASRARARSASATAGTARARRACWPAGWSRRACR